MISSGAPLWHNRTDGVSVAPRIHTGLMHGTVDWRIWLCRSFGKDCSCGLSLIPAPGNSMCHGMAKKERKKEKRKMRIKSKIIFCAMSKFSEIQVSHAHVCIRMTAFLLQGPGWTAMTETLWPKKSEIFKWLWITALLKLQVSHWLVSSSPRMCEQLLSHLIVGKTEA